MPFKCAILICPGPIWHWEPNTEGVSQDFGELRYVRSNEEKNLIQIPVAIISGAKDAFAEAGNLVRSLCVAELQESYEHSAGHGLPKRRVELDAIVKIVKSTINKALGQQ